MMNKAAGTVCSTVSDRRRTVYESFSENDLISPEGAKLHSVGRLDADTEGLLLFTNDGKFSNFLTRPESGIPKTYYVELKNPVSDAEKLDYVHKAGLGLMLPEDKKAQPEMCAPAKIVWYAENACQITVTEGKFHEVKRIFKALGNEVAYLKRLAFGGLALDNGLKAGEFRKLTENEVELLSCGGWHG